MPVHVKAFSTNPDIIHMETDESSVREAIGLIRLTFNRHTHKGSLFVEIDGTTVLYDPWFMTFWKWRSTTGWCLIKNPTYYFKH